jgi:hypothetical protein
MSTFFDAGEAYFFTLLLSAASTYVIMVLSDAIYYADVVDSECTTTCSIALVKMWLRGMRISNRNQMASVLWDSIPDTSVLLL